MVAEYRIEVVGGNRFNEGWLIYLLGLPRPDDEAAADAFDMAEETHLAMVRYVFERQPTLEAPQYVVSAIVESVD